MQPQESADKGSRLAGRAQYAASTPGASARPASWGWTSDEADQRSVTPCPSPSRSASAYARRATRSNHHTPGRQSAKSAHRQPPDTFSQTVRLIVILGNITSAVIWRRRGSRGHPPPICRIGARQSLIGWNAALLQLARATEGNGSAARAARIAEDDHSAYRGCSVLRHLNGGNFEESIPDA